MDKCRVRQVEMMKEQTNEDKKTDGVAKFKRAIPHILLLNIVLLFLLFFKVLF